MMLCSFAAPGHKARLVEDLLIPYSFNLPASVYRFNVHAQLNSLYTAPPVYNVLSDLAQLRQHGRHLHRP